MAMFFCEIGRLVACMLLIVVLSTVHGQPVQISSLDTDCHVDHLETQLARMEDRLNRMQDMISSMNCPSIKESCAIDLASYGFDDSSKYGYIKTSGGSSVQLYFPEEVDKYRGVILVALDANTCTVRSRQQFDTHASASDRRVLLRTMDSMAAGTIIVGVSADTPENEDNMSFINSVGSFFTSYNMNLTAPLFRDKFVFVIQKGYPWKTLFQRKSRYGESLIVKVVLRGSTIYDVTFIRL